MHIFAIFLVSWALLGSLCLADDSAMAVTIDGREVTFYTPFLGNRVADWFFVGLAIVYAAFLLGVALYSLAMRCTRKLK